MGQILTGGTQRMEDAQLLSPQQQQLLNQSLQSLGPQFLQSFGNALQPMGAEDQQALFQQTYVEPALQALNQQILPAVQQRFEDAGAGSSSALNQALSQAASAVSTNIGSQYGGFQQNQQAQLLQALGMFQPMLTQQTFQPMYQQSPGILGPMLQGGAALGAAYLGNPGPAASMGGR